MCDVVSSIFKGIGDVVSAVVSPIMGAVMPQADAPPPPAAPVLPPQAQAAQAPDEQARRASQRASGPTGPATAAAAGTMLTGPGGITNDLLNLGKNSLLGQ